MCHPLSPIVMMGHLRSIVVCTRRSYHTWGCCAQPLVLSLSHSEVSLLSCSHGAVAHSGGKAHSALQGSLQTEVFLHLCGEMWCLLGIPNFCWCAAGRSAELLGQCSAHVGVTADLTRGLMLTKRVLWTLTELSPCPR